MQTKILKFKCWAMLSMAGIMTAKAQTVTYDLDATKFPAVAKHALPEFSGTSPQGVRLGVNNRYFEKNGKPWFPVMGEFHYWRYPAEYWEEEIVKMKSAGLQIVATYIYWGAHEKTKGNWNWAGRLDLRRFIEICAKHAIYVWLRPGPYINGDVRGRGFPDRIYDMKGKRSNLPAYLSEVDAYFNQVGRQTKGLYWTDGGPVIGVQLENEYASGDSTHISRLKALAGKNGMSPVYWSVTANTVFRDREFEVLPMQGAYCYRGWETGKPLTSDFLFAQDQWIMEKSLGQVYYDVEQYPRGTCEQGAGMQETHGSRVSVEPHIIEAHAHNQMGRGVNFLGYFMFQGGTQYPGTEMKVSDGPMMPSGLVSYDYQAPLDEFGHMNESYKFLKLQHLFLNDFGDRLATTHTFRPAMLPSIPEDTSMLRYTGRFNCEGQGYVFICNTQNYLTMPARSVQLKVKLPGETITFPRKPVTLADGKIATWPVNFAFNGVNIKYATAQVLCKISGAKEETLFMYGTEGIAPELCIERNGIATVTAPDCTVDNSGALTYISPKALPASVSLKKKNGHLVRIVLLPRSDAENAWKKTINGQEHFFITTASLLFYPGNIIARQLGNPRINIRAFPGFAKGIPGFKTGKSNVFTDYSATLQIFQDEESAKTTSDSTAIINAGRPWPNYICDVFIKTTFRGNMVIAKMSDTVVADRLYYGKPWFLGLKRFRGAEPGVQQTLNVEIKGTYDQYAPQIIATSILPEYQVTIPANLP